MGTLRLLIAVVGGIHQKKSGLLQILNNLACYIYTACRSMGQGMGYTASVSNDIQAFVSAFHILRINRKCLVIPVSSLAVPGAILSRA